MLTARAIDGIAGPVAFLSGWTKHGIATLIQRHWVEEHPADVTVALTLIAIDPAKKTPADIKTKKPRAIIHEYHKPTPKAPCRICGTQTTTRGQPCTNCQPKATQ